MKQQYSLGEVCIRHVNYQEQITYDLSHFTDFNEFKECLLEEFNFYSEECYVSSSSLGFYEEGCSLEDAFNRYMILETIDNEDSDLLFEYDTYVKNLRFMSNDELKEIQNWSIIYETINEFTEIEIEDNINLLSEDIVRKRIEEKIRNNEIIESARGWLLVKMN